MNKKRILFIGAILGGIVAVVAVVALCRQRGGITSYGNFFEYAIDLEQDEYMFMPKRLSYGMSMEEVLEVEGLSEDTMNKESEIILTEKTYSNVSREIPELTFVELYTFSGEYGLVSITYQIIVEESELVKLSGMLYKQAIEYMPESNYMSMDLIKEGKNQITWDDAVFDEKNGWSTAKSCAALSFSDTADQKKAASLRIYLNPLYLKQKFISS